jgi:hypothetical protein
MIRRVGIRKPVLAVVLLPTLLAPSSLAQSDDANRSGIGADAAFDRVKTLVGTWRGTSDSGRRVSIEYRTGARGTTVMETQDPGTDEEMISVYSRDGAELVMTHYCPMGPVGNQPHMRLDRVRSTTDALLFDFTGGTNLDPNKDPHVHAARIIWLGANRIRREWDVYQDGHKAGITAFLVFRSGP